MEYAATMQAMLANNSVGNCRQTKITAIKSNCGYIQILYVKDSVHSVRKLKNKDKTVVLV